MEQFLQPAQSPQGLSETDMIAAMTLIMEGKADFETLSRFLMALAARGETVAEITGAARVLRAKVLPISAPEGAVDCCGTGGDLSGTYNISTAVAMVAAACGVPIAKHGNRAASSKSGAADVLEALGVNLNAPREKLEEALRRFGFAFLMAPNHHQAMRHVIDVRRALKTRTIFNLLGPLANPAGTRIQLLGVYDRKWLLPMAETLRNLGSDAAWVVHGADGLDEITVTGPTHIAALAEGKITERLITPDDFGLKTWRPETLKGGTPAENAAALRAVLDGTQNAYRDCVLANTAAVLLLSAKATDLKHGASIAAQAIDTGAARALLADYITFTTERA